MVTSYETDSGFSKLIGTMEVDDNDVVTKYTSKSNGSEGTFPGKTHYVTNFKVKFGTGRTYHINSQSAGDNYFGSADDEKSSKSQEPWVATATTKKPKRRQSGRSAVVGNAAPKSPVGPKPAVADAAKSSPTARTANVQPVKNNPRSTKRPTKK